jgi:hypothetical protein
MNAARPGVAHSSYAEEPAAWETDRDSGSDLADEEAVSDDLRGRADRSRQFGDASNRQRADQLRARAPVQRHWSPAVQHPRISMPAAARMPNPVPLFSSSPVPFTPYAFGTGAGTYSPDFSFPPNFSPNFSPFQGGAGLLAGGLGFGLGALLGHFAAAVLSPCAPMPPYGGFHHACFGAPWGPPWGPGWPWC